MKNTISKSSLFFSIFITCCLLVMIFIGGCKIYQQFLSLGQDKKIADLNRMMPHFYKYMVALLDEPNDVSDGQINEFVKYYELVNKYTPPNAGAYSLLGFCYYHLGQQDKSLESYFKASILNPDFFWPHYNAGVIYFHQQNYVKSIYFLERALLQEKMKTLKYIYISKNTYGPLLKYEQISMDQVESQWISSYDDLGILLVLSYGRLNQLDKVMDVGAHLLKMGNTNRDFLLYHMAMASYKLKQYGQAVEFLKESIEEGVPSFETYMMLSRVLKNLGKVEAAANIDVMAKKIQAQNPKGFSQGKNISLMHY